MSESDLFRSVRRRDRRRAHLAVRIVRWAVVLTVLVMFAVVGWLLWRATNTLEPLELQTFILNETDPDAVTDEVRGTSTTLVVGVDRRSAPPEDIADSTADPRGPAVTEAVYLMQDSPARSGMAVITFPADLAVNPPGVVGQTRLDRVQALGGPDLLLATLQQEAGMPIDHYVEVDLAGLVPLVDAVGGVQVCLDQLDLGAEPAATGIPSPSPGPSAPGPSVSASPGPAMSDTSSTTPSPAPGSTAPTSGPAASPAPAPSTSASGTAAASPSPPATATDGATELPGCQVLDGAAAAGFLSSRSDAGLAVRRQRQRLAEQHVLLARLLERLTQTSVLANPFRADAIIDALPGAVATDIPLGLPGQVRTAGEVAEFDPASLVVRVVPTQRLPDQALQQFQPEQAQALFAAVRGGADLSDIGTSTTRQLGPSDVSVVVVNGVGIEGLASRVSSFLDQRGFIVGGALNPSDLDPVDGWDEDQVVTVLRYVEGNEDLVAILTNDLGELEIELEPLPQLPPMPRGVTVDEPTVLLEVGSGWDQ